MNRRAHKPATKDTPFERETKRRRAEMLRNFAGFRVNMPRKRLHVCIATGVKPVVVKGVDGEPVFLTQPNTRPNPYRAIARQQARHSKAVQA